MGYNIKKTTEPNLIVREIKHPKEESGVGKLMNNSKSRKAKIVVIEHTFDETIFPVGSKWMMGDTPLEEYDLYGSIMYKTKDIYLYAEIE